MNHLEFNSGSLRYSLTGNCITVFNKSGVKIWHRFFESVEVARKAFLELA